MPRGVTPPHKSVPKTPHKAILQQQQRRAKHSSRNGHNDPRSSHVDLARWCYQITPAVPSLTRNDQTNQSRKNHKMS